MPSPYGPPPSTDIDTPFGKVRVNFYGDSVIVFDTRENDGGTITVNGVRYSLRLDMKQYDNAEGFQPLRTYFGNDQSGRFHTGDSLYMRRAETPVYAEATLAAKRKVLETLPKIVNDFLSTDEGQKLHEAGRAHRLNQEHASALRKVNEARKALAEAERELVAVLNEAVKLGIDLPLPA